MPNLVRNEVARIREERGVVRDRTLGPSEVGWVAYDDNGEPVAWFKQRCELHSESGERFTVDLMWSLIDKQEAIDAVRRSTPVSGTGDLPYGPRLLR